VKRAGGDQADRLSGRHMSRRLGRPKCAHPPRCDQRHAPVEPEECPLICRGGSGRSLPSRPALRRMRCSFVLSRERGTQVVARRGVPPSRASSDTGARGARAASRALSRRSATVRSPPAIGRA
jgi:hypothetical protein